MCEIVILDLTRKCPHIDDLVVTLQVFLSLRFQIICIFDNINHQSI